jgi:L-amino acid N-acyltransferase YncA
LNVSVSECVELDRLNMGPILEAAGETFDAGNREARLKKSLATNGQLVGIWRDGKLVAYSELKFTGDRCALWSIQVHPRYQHGPVLLGLLRRVAEMIDPARVKIVASAAHTRNEKSIRLHRLLGFHEVGESGEKIQFEVSAGELARRLHTTALVNSAKIN